MLRFASVVALVLAALLGARAADYCSVCSDHTMCQYAETDIGSSCADHQTATLTTTDINAIVHRHNLLRNRVATGQETAGLTNAQPSGSNMRKMIWSRELATIAQRWANQCNFQHDTCRNAADETYVGQNIFWESSSAALSSPNWTKPIQSWYDEVNDRDGSLNVEPFSASASGDAVVGHYTQVAWADSYKVGCGYSDYTEDGWYSRIVVCNYSPGGNVIGDYMYQSGDAASNCPSGTEQDSYYTGLCKRS